jgi:hypothetical protein
MEPEEAPNRAASMSSEMMSTVRDDPESYKELLEKLKKDRAAARQNPSGPNPAAPQVPGAAPPAPPSIAPPAAQPVAPPPTAAGYNYPPAAPGYAAQNYPPAPNYPAPPAKGGKPYVILGIVVAAIILVVILLFAFKLI